MGRGGSDTTAVAIAAGLKADMCDIYTDVDGVYTADPRIVPGAQKLDEITFVEMLELARLGAGVMQPRAVEYGEHNALPSMYVLPLTTYPELLLGRNTQCKRKTLLFAV